MVSINLFDLQTVRKIYPFKTGFISLLLSLTLLVGCSDDDCPPCSTPTDDRISFEINFLEYSDNNYFIDEVYADTSSQLNMFNLYYGNIPSMVLLKYYVKEIEVYKSINVLSGSSIYACAYIDLESRHEYSTYNDSLRNLFNPIPGKEEVGRFSLLNEVRDYLFHRETGYITFTSALNEQDVIAIAYRIENDNFSDWDDLIYGEFFADLITNSDTVAVLKLLKPRNLRPVYSIAWKMKMRNIYQIITYIGQFTNLDLDIYLKKSDGSETNSINNVRLLELFGFDKLNENGALGTDGKFDNRIGINYEPRTSEIIFPVIEPFGDNIPPLLNEYKYDSIYDTVKTYLTLPENYFIIKGKYKPI
jgi:hypothetical protein